MIDQYKHLNKKGKVRVEIDMEEIAQLIHDMNYGAHRFLSAWIQIRKRQGFRSPDRDKLALGIEKLLEEGLY